MFALVFALTIAAAAPAAIDARAETFESAALSWVARGDVQVRVRASVDGETWSEWRDVTIDEDLTDRTEGRYYSSIVHFGSEYRFIEYSGDVTRVSATLFPLAEPRDHGGAGSYTLGPLTIRSRSDWGCPDGQGSRWTPSFTTVTHAIVHHTAGANTVPDWEAEVRNIWYFHTVTRGWGDIGYNFLIDPNGTIYEGRAGGDGALGAHFSCRNTNTVGVSMLGTYTAAPPAPAAMASLEALLRELTKKHGLVSTDVARHVPTGLDLPRVSAHRDANPSPAACSTTECPGNALYATLPSLRAAIACDGAAIRAHPSSVSANANAWLTVAATGTAPLAYQWYSGTTPIDGATGASYHAAPGTYWVRVTNACGSADSRTATVGALPRRRAR